MAPRKTFDRGNGVIVHSYGPFTTITEYPDGTAEYSKGLTNHFRVRISDVRGFSRAKGPKWSSDPTLNLLGQGTVIATVHECSKCDEIEAWFRAHPSFGGNSPSGVHGSSAISVADELQKLANLLERGVLTEAEFQAEKAKLLSR